MKFKENPVFVIYMLCFFLLGCNLFEDKNLLRPNGVAVSADMEIYIMDLGHNRVVVLSDDLKYLRSFGHFGREAPDISHSWDIAIDTDKNVFLTNYTLATQFGAEFSDSIKMFDKFGKFVREIGVTQGKESENKYSQYGVHISRKNRIYLPSYYSDVVRVFDKQNNSLGTIDVSPKRAVKMAKGVTDVVTNADESLMYVIDLFLAEIRKYRLDWDSDGKVTGVFLNKVGENGNEPSLLYPKYMVLNEQKNTIYVSDMGNQRVVELTDDGKIIKELKLGRTWQPFGLAIDNKERLLVADAFGNKIIRFSQNGLIETY